MFLNLRKPSTLFTPTSAFYSVKSSLVYKGFCSSLFLTNFPVFVALATILFVQC